MSLDTDRPTALASAIDSTAAARTATARGRDASRYVAQTRRRVLCVFPRYAKSFGTFQNAYPLFGGRITAFMPPQGLLVVAAYLPKVWEVRIVDENTRLADDADFQWADVVFVSGMHIQRDQICDIVRRGHVHGRPAVLGGPSVSASPEDYPDADMLHVGELGDGTDQLIEYLDTHTGRPPHPRRFHTRVRLPLAEFPLPAYHLIPLRQYFIASVQYSSGCPYTCEFCDIPALYGRAPRLKTPTQVLAELDAIAAVGATTVYFVDDNFIANQKATLELLPHLVVWQEQHRFPLRFACEATLNLAANDRILALMRDAGFHTVFCGIETPEPEALRGMSKLQNLRMPLLDAVSRMNSYGLEVVSGIIIGLDTDTADTADRIIEFIRVSRIPVLTINVLHALPKTPLWHRLETAGRISRDVGRASNVVFKMGEEKVLAIWRKCITAAYTPGALYERFAHHVQFTFPRRKALPLSPQRASWGNLLMALGILRRILWRIGIRGHYRHAFWRLAWPALKKGDIEAVIHVAVVSHHLIEFTADCLQGTGESSFYSSSASGDAPRIAA